MNTVTLVGALYVVVPAILMLAAWAYAVLFPVTIEEEVTMSSVVYTQLAIMANRRAIVNRDSAHYWTSVAVRATEPAMRYKAMMYAKLYGDVAESEVAKGDEWARLSDCR